MRLTPDDRLCIPVPFYHCFGMVLANLPASRTARHGRSWRRVRAASGPGDDRGGTLHRAAWRADHVHRGAGAPGLRAISICPSLRTGIMAGSPCPIEVMRRVIGEMNMSEITIGYGMTETSPVSFRARPEDPIERRVSTVGRIHPHLEVKIVDENGRIVPRGITGELCTRGYSVMKGYWDDPEKTAEAIDEAGWMHTGDLATLDEQGYCNIVGRIKDMVIRGGENIYPREIEEFLYGHPEVQDVQVFGVPTRSTARSFVPGSGCATAPAWTRRRSAPSVAAHCPLQGAAATFVS